MLLMLGVGGSYVGIKALERHRLGKTIHPLRWSREFIAYLQVLHVHLHLSDSLALIHDHAQAVCSHGPCAQPAD